MGDFRLALGMKHPHDVIEQMDLDVAMTCVSCCPAFARSGEVGTKSSLYGRLCHARACLATQAYVSSVGSNPSCKRIRKG